MLRDTVEFFKREKQYGILFLLMLIGFGYFHFYAIKPVPPADSQALANFRVAEQKLQDQFAEAGSMESFAKDNPEAAVILQSLMIVAVALFVIGLTINLLILFNPGWRKKLTNQLEPAKTDWRISMVFKILLLFMAANFGIGLIVGLIHENLFGRGSENFFLLFQTTLADITLFLLMVYLIHQAGGHWRDLGFRSGRRGIWGEIVTGVVGYMAVFPVFLLSLLGLVILANFLAYEPTPHPLVTVFLEEENRSPILIVYSILLATVVGPIFEEIFFRGYCYPIFKKRWGRGFALVLTAMFFAFVHNNEFAFFPIFILGLGLGYLYDKRQSLYGPMTLHVIHNVIFIGYFFIAKQVVAQA